MNILHITDIHFGPYHWAADDNCVLERLNAFNADVVFNTGDLTSDSLESEFEEARDFLGQLKCSNVLSIMGNHDKYAKGSHLMFRDMICDGPFLAPKDPSKIEKPHVYFEPHRMTLDTYLTETTYVRVLDIRGEKTLVICIDTNQFQSDRGYVEEQMLHSIAGQMAGLTYDRALMLSHHSSLSTDEDPTWNSKRVTDFILEHNIEAVFCGHTHELDIVEVSDIVRGGAYRQFMCGSLASINISRDSNMFCTYENFGTAEEIITVTRMYPKENGIEFVETVVGR